MLRSQSCWNGNALKVQNNIKYRKRWTGRSDLKYIKAFTPNKVLSTAFYFCLLLWDNICRYRWSVKIERIKKKKDESFTVTISEHTIIRFALVVHYLEGMGVYIGEDCFNVFVKKLNEILSNFTNFEREMEMLMRDDQKKKYNEARDCYLCNGNFIK